MHFRLPKIIQLLKIKLINNSGLIYFKNEMEFFILFTFLKCKKIMKNKIIKDTLMYIVF